MAIHAKGAATVARRASAKTRRSSRKPRTKLGARSKASNQRLGGGDNGVANTALA